MCTTRWAWRITSRWSVSSSGDLHSIAWHPVRVLSIVISVSVCLSVCSRISKTTRPSLNFLYMAVVRSSSDGNAIRYALPVLQITSCFHIMKQMSRNKKRRVCFFRPVRQVAAPEMKSAVFWLHLVYCSQHGNINSRESNLNNKTFMKT